MARFTSSRWNKHLQEVGKMIALDNKKLQSLLLTCLSFLCIICLLYTSDAADE